MDPSGAQPPEPFWRYLNAWLAQRGWTQMRLADELGVHQTVVGKWLHADPRRRTRPSRRTLGELAHVLGKSPSDLMLMLMVDQPDTGPLWDTPRDSTREAIERVIAETSSEMRLVLEGVPRPYWLPVLKAFRRGVDSARDLAQLLADGLPPVSAPQEGDISARDRQLTREQSNRDAGLTGTQPRLTAMPA